jgi:hypothetical protein
MDEKFAALFEPLENTTPFLKTGITGMAGSGKSFTSALIAAGLHAREKRDRPVVIFDTEQSSKFLKPLFKKAGIPVMVKRSRALVDLVEVMRACDEGHASVLLIDSISHIWENFIQAYKGNRKFIEVWDWGILKPKWKEGFADPFVQLRCHCVFTGRAGWEYSEHEVEKDGEMKTEVRKSGIKMRTETETAFEPDLVVLMERMQELSAAGLKTWRQATILKDRSTLIDGKVFVNPSYSDFAPVVEFLLDSPKPETPRVMGNDADLFRSSGDAAGRRERQVLLEKIEGSLVILHPGQKAGEKAGRLSAMKRTLGTVSTKELETMDLAKLREGLACLEQEVAAKAAPSATSSPE